MFCPRCGEEVEERARFCSACGETLPAPDAAGRRSGWRDRLSNLVGSTRKERFAAAVTAVALGLAVVAFIALDPAEDGAARDPYTTAADQMCVDAKRSIADAGADALRGRSAGTPDFAQAVVRTATEWRLAMRDIAPPAGRREAAVELESALMEVATDAAALARAARGGDGSRIQAETERVDEASGRVESAIDSLGLERCSAIRLVPGGGLFTDRLGG